MDKEKARQEIGKLVDRFIAEQPYYESNSYLERQLQTDFIDKLFEELGWDIANTKGLSPFDREVLVEKGDTKGRPDYSFRINGEDTFFGELKMTHIPVGEQALPPLDQPTGAEDFEGQPDLLGRQRGLLHEVRVGLGRPLPAGVQRLLVSEGDAEQHQGGRSIGGGPLHTGDHVRHY